MNVFICVKYQEDCLAKIPEIKKAVEDLGHKAYCFATDAKKIENAKEMMAQALEKVNEADILLIESSEQSFGAGIEAGYGFAKGKKIISVAKNTSEPSKTLEGISNDYITYKDSADLKVKLKEALT